VLLAVLVVVFVNIPWVGGVFDWQEGSPLLLVTHEKLIEQIMGMPKVRLVFRIECHFRILPAASEPQVTPLTFSAGLLNDGVVGIVARRRRILFISPAVP
jgi:hypothetical protein